MCLTTSRPCPSTTSGMFACTASLGNSIIPDARSSLVSLFPTKRPCSRWEASCLSVANSVCTICRGTPEQVCFETVLYPPLRRLQDAAANACSSPVYRYAGRRLQQAHHTLPQHCTPPCTSAADLSTTLPQHSTQRCGRHRQSNLPSMFAASVGPLAPWPCGQQGDILAAQPITEGLNHALCTSAAFSCQQSTPGGSTP